MDRDKSKKKFFFGHHLNDILRGIKFSFGIFIFFGILFGIVYAVGFHTANEVLSGTFLGDYNFTGEVVGIIPSGQITSFYLASCPTGWKACDGTNGTPDLRGQFIRGLNSFDEGLTTRSDGNEDPDSRSLGDFQADMFKSHTHTVKDSGVYGRGSGTVASQHPDDFARTKTTSATGGGETRPKNVALIYCQKE